MKFGNLSVGDQTASVAYSRNRQDGTYRIIPLAAQDESVLRKLVAGESTVNLEGDGGDLTFRVVKWGTGPFPALVCERAD